MVFLRIKEITVPTVKSQNYLFPQILCKRIGHQMLNLWWRNDELVVIAIYFVYVTSSVEIAICFRMFQANNSTHILAAKISTS